MERDKRIIAAELVEAKLTELQLELAEICIGPTQVLSLTDPLPEINQTRVNQLRDEIKEYQELLGLLTPADFRGFIVRPEE